VCRLQYPLKQNYFPLPCIAVIFFILSYYHIFNITSYRLTTDQQTDKYCLLSLIVVLYRFCSLVSVTYMQYRYKATCHFQRCMRSDNEIRLHFAEGRNYINCHSSSKIFSSSMPPSQLVSSYAARNSCCELYGVIRECCFWS
jgi:hypothetical protein